MVAITRNTDLSMGICSCCCPSCPHVWISVHVGGSGRVRADRLGVMRAPGDIGVSNCPHCPTSFAVTGSPKNYADGRAIHRLGDVHNVSCGTGRVITASRRAFSR